MAQTCTACRLAADIAIARQPLVLNISQDFVTILQQDRFGPLRELKLLSFSPLPSLLPPLFGDCLPPLAHLTSLTIVRIRLPTDPEGWHGILAGLPSLKKLDIAFLPRGRAASPRSAALATCALAIALAEGAPPAASLETLRLKGCSR